MNQIHNTAIVTGDVIIGKRNKILPYTIITGPINIGDDNIIGPHVVIGSPGADTRNPHYDSSQHKIIIGNRNIIREFSSIQKSCYKDCTIIGSDIYIMPNVHIQHDDILKDGVVIAASSALAGLVNILDYAYLAMGCTVCQYCTIGQYSIVATGAPVTKHVKPFSKYIPNKPLAVNLYAIKKYGFENYENEISDYVLYNKYPVTKKMSTIIQTYDTIKLSSGNKTEYVSEFSKIDNSFTRILKSIE